MGKQSIEGTEVGQTAPDFTAKDVYGNQVSLSSLDSRYILLVFLRYSGCPWCNLAIHRLSLEYATLRSHECEVVAFIQSKPENIIDNVYNRHAEKPQFPIVPDSDMNIYKLYGVGKSLSAGVRSLKNIPHWLHSVKEHGYKQESVDGSLFVVPASFLIDGRTKKITQIHCSSSYYETEAFLDIYKSVFFKEL